MLVFSCEGSVLIEIFAARKAGGKGRTRRKTAESSDEDDVIDSSKTPVPRTQRARGTKKKPVVSFSSDEDSDIELFEVDKASKFEMDKGSKKKKGNFFFYFL